MVTCILELPTDSMLQISEFNGSFCEDGQLLYHVQEFYNVGNFGSPKLTKTLAWAMSPSQEIAHQRGSKAIGPALIMYVLHVLYTNTHTHTHTHTHMHTYTLCIVLYNM